MKREHVERGLGSMGTAATPREARAGLLSIPGRSGSRSRRPRLETEMLRLRRWLPGPMALPQPEEGQISGQEPPGLTYGSIRPCWQGWCGQSLQVRRKTGISVESNYPAGSPAALPVPRPCYLYLPWDFSPWALASTVSPSLLASASALFFALHPLYLSLSLSVSISF